MVAASNKRLSRDKQRVIDAFAAMQTELLAENKDGVIRTMKAGAIRRNIGLTLEPSRAMVIADVDRYLARRESVEKWLKDKKYGLLHKRMKDNLQSLNERLESVALYLMFHDAAANQETIMKILTALQIKSLKSMRRVQS